MLSTLGFGESASRLQSNLERAEERGRAVAAAQVKHASARPNGSDLDALVDWKRKEQDFALQLEAAGEAIEFASNAIRERAAADERERAEQKYRAGKQLVPAHRKLAEEIVRESRKLAAKLHRLEQLRAEIALSSAALDDHPQIIDGEAELRHVAERVLPAQYRDGYGWRDRRGKPPTVMVKNLEGQDVPVTPRNYRWVATRELVAREKVTPAHMPRRFAEAFVLVDLDGSQIWPSDRAPDAGDVE